MFLSFEDVTLVKPVVGVVQMTQTHSLDKILQVVFNKV